MPANTSKGWPYVLATDNVADYPTTSQALATMLDASVPYAQQLGMVVQRLGRASMRARRHGRPHSRRRHREPRRSGLR